LWCRGVPCTVTAYYLACCRSARGSANLVSSIVRRVLNYDVLVSGGGVRVSDVTRGEGV